MRRKEGKGIIRTKKESIICKCKKKIIPMVSGAAMACSLMTTNCFAVDTSVVTKPMDAEY